MPINDAEQQEKIDQDLFYLIARGNVSESLKMINLGADPNRLIGTPKKGITILMHAINCRMYKAAEALIMRGADVNKESYTGNLTKTSSPLFHSVMMDERGGSESIIRMLVDYGANMDKVSKNDYTPLSYAVNTRKYVIANALIDLGAKIRIGVTQNDDAMHFAIESRNAEIIAKMEGKLLLNLAIETVESPEKIEVKSMKRMRL